MELLARIAWRNIWRNARRSGVLISAVAVAIFCFVGSTTFMDGLMQEMITSTLETQGGHIQIAREGYFDRPTVGNAIRQPDGMRSVLGSIANLRWAPHIEVSGMISSAGRSGGVQIHGVDPEQESAVSTVPTSIVRGRFLTSDTADISGSRLPEIVIGKSLARRLDVRLDERVVLMVSDLQNEMSSGAYRVVGFFNTPSEQFDRSNVFLTLETARNLVSYQSQVSYFTIWLPDAGNLEQVTGDLRGRLHDRKLSILTWEERFPLLSVSLEAYDYTIFVLAIILFTAVAFTIINSFLMIILERVREMGIMMANGLRPRQVRLMLYLEAAFIVLLGTGVGVAFSGVLLAVWNSAGLNLSGFAEALGVTGIGAVIYPHFDWLHLGGGLALILVTSLIAVIYPAFRASGYEPVEAIEFE